ncbi:MAG: hypothetical protein P4L59_09545 [Desulfosporosinus sp.]|nr:hypothetical protein [Desulfosporosinus sp.]
MWSKKVVFISVISTTALLASVGIAGAMPNFSQGQLSQKSGIAFSHMNKKVGRAGLGGSMSSVMKVVTQDLNISNQTLMSELSSGKSINDIAAAQKADKAKLATDVQAALTANITQAVQSGKMTSAQATTMESKLTQRVQNILSRTRQAKGNRGAGLGGSMSSVLKVVTQDLNISNQTLMSELGSGKSINDIATAQKADKAKLATDVQAALTANITQAVQSGKITSDQATTRESKLTQQVQNILSRTRQSQTRKNNGTQNATTLNL